MFMYNVCMCVCIIFCLSLPITLTDPFLSSQTPSMPQYLCVSITQLSIMFDQLPSISCNTATFPFKPSRNLFISLSSVL